MAITSLDKKQINLYYNSNLELGRKVVGYIKSSDKKILAVDVLKSRPSKTQWAEWSQALSVPLKNFIDFSQIKKVNESEDYSEMDLINILDHHPHAFRGCILINGNTKAFITDAQQALTFLGADSKGLEKKPLGEQATTSSQTDDESFI